MAHDISKKLHGTRYLSAAPGKQRQQGTHCIRPLVVPHDFNMCFFIGINTRCNGDMIRIIRIFVMCCDGKQCFRVCTNTIAQLIGDFRQQALAFTFEK